jgi:Gpi18-like mannosyltransferase
MASQLRQFRGWVLSLTLLALAARVALFRYVNGDLTTFLVPWYRYIVSHGGYRALGQAFSNYAPPYTYLLVAATYLQALLPAIAAIKAISIVFDLAAAALVYRLAALAGKPSQGPCPTSAVPHPPEASGRAARLRLPHLHGSLPWIAFAAVLWAPTVIVNSAYWGQCDAIYTTFLLGALYVACRRRPLWCVVSFSVALAFKAQAVFLGPFMLLLLLRGRISWRSMLLVPAVYALLAAPCLLLGRSPVSVLTVYLAQADAYHTLARNAASIYQFLPDSAYSIFSWLGLLVAGAAGLALAVAGWRSRAPLTDELLVLAACLSVSLMPLLLLKMHERYFFPADVLTIALAFFDRRRALVPILFQITSLLSYTPFLKGIVYVPLPLLSLINVGTVAWLALEYGRALYPRADRATVPPAPAG